MFVYGAWIAIKLSLGLARRETFGLLRVRDAWSAVKWAAAAYAGFWLVTILLDRDLRHARRSGAGDRHQGARTRSRSCSPGAC